MFSSVLSLFVRTVLGSDAREPHQAQLSPAGASLVIVAIGAPALIGSPSVIGSSAIVPALWAVISFSIFIASMMHSSWPSCTSSPCLTSTFHMFPCRGEGRVSGPPPLEDLRWPRLGALRAAPAPAVPPPFRAAPAPAPPANGGPITR